MTSDLAGLHLILHQYSQVGFAAMSVQDTGYLLLHMPPALLPFAASLAARAPAVDTSSCGVMTPSCVPIATDGWIGRQVGLDDARPKKQPRLGEPDVMIPSCVPAATDGGIGRQVGLDDARPKKQPRLGEPDVMIPSCVPAATDGGIGRQVGLDDARPKKQPRLGEPDGDWICRACGNANFANRVACNMRKCGALRGAPRQDWQCTACGNVNFADRMFCNMRKCGVPRQSAGVASDQQVVIPRTLPSSPQSSGGLVVEEPSAPMPREFATAKASERAQGACVNADSICTVLPTPSPVQTQQMPQMLQAQQTMQQDTPSTNATAGRTWAPRPASKVVPTAQAQALGRPRAGGPDKRVRTNTKRGAKKGDWRCSCGNWNIKPHAFCDTCELARVLEQWVCHECSNLNFADRAFCNMRRCMSPRRDVEPTVLNKLFSKGLGTLRR